MNGLGKAALQSRVRINEIVHLIRIARHDTNELAAVVLQALQQCIYCLGAKGITITRLEGIGFINKENATQCLINKLIGLDCRLTRIASHQFRAISLYQLTTGDNTQGLEDIGHDTGYSRLTCTWITRKHIMFALEGIGLATLDLKVQIRCQIRHLFLDSSKSNQTIEFYQAIVDIDRLRCFVWYILLLDGHQFFV